MNQWKYDLRCYFADKKLIWGYIFYLTYVLYRLYILILKYGDYTTIISYTQEVNRFGMYGCVVFSLLSYWYINKMKTQNYEEILLTNAKSYRKYIFNRLKILFTLASFIWGITFLSSLAELFLKIKPEPLQIHHFLLNFLLYIITPMTIGILFGTVLALWMNYKAAYSLILLLWFGVTSVSEAISIQLLGTGINLYTVLNYLKIGQPDPGYATNSMYGIPMESFQWALRGMWLFALLYFLARKMIHSKRCIIQYVFLTFTLMMIPFLVNQGSRIQQENGVQSGSSEWGHYYSKMWENCNQHGAEAPAKVEAANYQISGYEMKLNLARELKAEVIIAIQDPQEKMCFTLFEGYKIKKITDQEGKNISFIQEGHYVTITPDNPQRIKQITFVYQGHSKKFYSNSLGACLPGYFAWYPMPGKRSMTVYLRENVKDGYTDFSGYNTTINDLQEKEFRIEISGNLKNIFTSLERREDHLWQGTAKTVTILSGMVKETKSNSGILVYSQMDTLDAELIPEQILSGLLEAKEQWDLDGNNEFKTIFCMDSMFNYMGGDGESTIDMGDHILITEAAYHSWIPELLLNPMSQSGSQEYLKRVLLYKMQYGFTSQEQNIFYEVSPDQISKSELLEYYLDRKVMQYGEKTVVNKVYHYLKEENPSENPLEFLRNL